MTQAGMPHSNAIRPALPLMVIMTLLTAILLFWKLGSVPLTNWDEGIHSSVALETFQKHNWISLTYHDELYTAKPPLKFWLTVPMYYLFGPTEFASRLWSALAGLATVWLLMIWIWQATNSKLQTGLVAMVFLGGRFLHDHSFRTGETDGLLILFVTLGLYAYWKSARDLAWWWVVGTAIGLAVMTKSVGGLLPAMIIGADILLGNRWKELPWKNILYAIGLAVLIIAPWHLIETFRHGQEFWSWYFSFHVVSRTTHVLYANYVAWDWYWQVVRNYFFPWSAFFFLSLAFGISGWWKKRDTLDRLLVLWTLIVLIVFSIVKTKFTWYALPVYPALAMLMVRVLWATWQPHSRWLWIGWWLSTLHLFYMIPPRFTRSGLLWHLTPYAYLPASINQSMYGRLITALLLGAGLMMVTFFLRRGTKWSLLKVASLLTVGYMCLLAYAWHGHFLKNEPTTSSLKTIAAKVQELGVEDLYQHGIQPLSQPAGYFYLRRIPVRVHESWTPDFVPNAYILTTNKESNAVLAASGEIILKQGRFILLKTGAEALH